MSQGSKFRGVYGMGYSPRIAFTSVLTVDRTGDIIDA